jgi:aquaporin Z
MKMSSTTHRISAEFIGTMFFIFLGASVTIFSKTTGALGIPVAFGFAYAVSHYLTESASGGHLNPAISLAMFLSKKLDMKMFLFYVIAQLAGAALAGYVCYTLMVNLPDMAALSNTNFIGSNMMSSGIVEILLTSFVVLTFLNATSNKGSCACNSLILGIAVMLGTFLAIPFTNASLNPARSFGTALMENGQALGQSWFFFVMPFLGAVLATLLNRLLGNK